jgi:hypothetical protein
MVAMKYDDIIVGAGSAGAAVAPTPPPLRG